MQHSAAAPDAVVVGSGPNGPGLRVTVMEGAQTPGGGCRTQELTLPGFRHDVCAAVHPLGAASPFFTGADLPGLTLLTPRVAFAHPLDGGLAAALTGSVPQTAAALGRDGAAYRRLMAPLVRDADSILPAVLAPLLRSVPVAPLALARFATRGLPSAALAASRYRTAEARALLAGVSAHAMRPLSAPLTAGLGMVRRARAA